MKGPSSIYGCTLALISAVSLIDDNITCLEHDKSTNVGNEATHILEEREHPIGYDSNRSYSTSEMVKVTLTRKINVDVQPGSSVERVHKVETYRTR